MAYKANKDQKANIPKINQRNKLKLIYDPKFRNMLKV
jgi:hypothetical protein